MAFTILAEVLDISSASMGCWLNGWRKRPGREFMATGAEVDVDLECCAIGHKTLRS